MAFISATVSSAPKHNARWRPVLSVVHHPFASRLGSSLRPFLHPRISLCYHKAITSQTTRRQKADALLKSLSDTRHEEELERRQVAWRLMKRRDKEKRAKEAKERVKAERAREKTEKKAYKALLKSGAVRRGSKAQMAEEGEAGNTSLGLHFLG
ncbi:uncharacterized protein LOC123519996 [Portunus trituberculatus]|uniref:uncharacterized protein LOC123519996 n=1 Tax=Portunus trituberculatus TaxID=210409 RepID=UPI001E1CC19C|nr:uncharacterized protein LOC123519996 [Portunus trituberculatus]